MDGCFHDYGYVNFKSYLTFDEDGNEQWSEPERYLADYRSIESKYGICEVGMFRSPDGNGSWRWQEVIKTKLIRDVLF